jgi:hypothetical protein
MPTVGPAEIAIVVVWVILIGLVLALPFWVIGQIRRSRDRVDALERRIDELEGQAKHDRP